MGLVVHGDRGARGTGILDHRTVDDDLGTRWQRHGERHRDLRSDLERTNPPTLRARASRSKNVTAAAHGRHDRHDRGRCRFRPSPDAPSRSANLVLRSAEFAGADLSLPSRKPTPLQNIVLFQYVNTLEQGLPVTSTD